MAIKRTDQAMVDAGLAASLEEARLWILEGRVYQGAGKVAKPSDKFKEGLPLTVRGEKREYVSRGAYKLLRALEAFHIEVTNQVAMDVGSSTGGFTDVLLKHGAKQVYAIDVGHGQLDYTLREDRRVVVMEKTNARFLTKDMFPVPPTFGATDVSFISLKAILPTALSMLEGEHAQFVALIKPQFEAAKEQVGAKGVVRDKAVHIQVVKTIVDFVQSIGWCPCGIDHSPITGPEGNIEFLLQITRNGTPVSEEEIVSTVHQSHDKFMNSWDIP